MHCDDCHLLLKIMMKMCEVQGPMQGAGSEGMLTTLAGQEGGPVT
jgi:hypothetical protein